MSQRFFSNLGQILAGLGLLFLLWPAPATGANIGSSCATSASGDFLREDGHADQPWAVKAPGRPEVYIEHCMMEKLLSFFPDIVRNRLLRGQEPSRYFSQPAAWKTRDGKIIATLSPQSRFQVAAAIMYVESHFHPNVSLSAAGAVGPFQVLPTTGSQMKLPDVDYTPTNLQAGLKYILYIEEQIARHCDFEESSKEDSMRYRNLIAASYNAGPGHMAKKDEVGRACRIEAFPDFTHTEYLRRFNQAMGYRYLPAQLRKK